MVAKKLGADGVVLDILDAHGNEDIALAANRSNWQGRST